MLLPVIVKHQRHTCSSRSLSIRTRGTVRHFAVLGQIGVCIALGTFRAGHFDR